MPPKKPKKPGKKNGDKGLVTAIADQKIAERLIETGSVKKCAEELGVHRNTIYKAANRALTDDMIRQAVQRSRDRNIKMLGLCDNKTLSILKDTDPVQAGNQIKIISSIYKTFGVWKDEAVVQINHFTPIQVVVGDESFDIKVGAPQETGSSVQEREQDNPVL
jgi:transposase